MKEKRNKDNTSALVRGNKPKINKTPQINSIHGMTNAQKKAIQAGKRR